MCGYAFTIIQKCGNSVQNAKWHLQKTEPAVTDQSDNVSLTATRDELPTENHADTVYIQNNNTN